MRPFDTDTSWETIERALKAGPLTLVIYTLAQALQTNYEFTEGQAQVAADMLARSTRDPSPERARLVGFWQSSKKQGVPGFGGYSWDIDEYRFHADFTYVQGYHGLSGVQTPSTNPVQVTVGPRRISSNLSGVYQVGIQDDSWCALCLCSAHSGSAIVRRFYFAHARQLYMNGLTFNKVW